MGSDQTPYVPIHLNIWDHPKTRRFARELGINPEEAGLRLIRMWQWAFVYASDGNLCNFTPQDIADGARYIGDADQFVEALELAGFATDRILHDWEDYAGKVLVKRKRSAEYMKDYRKGYVSLTQGSRKCKEKRRIESNDSCSSANAMSVPRGDSEALSGFDGFWEMYGYKVAKQEAQRAWRKLSKSDKTAVMDSLSPHPYEDRPKDKWPYPATFLNGKRWLDERPSRNGHDPQITLAELQVDL